jgi:hypothetical protein
MTDEQIKEMAAKLNAQKDELKPYFDQVYPTSDWKAPIDAFCRREDKEKVAEAVKFFTATEATFQEPVPPSKDWLRVHSIGYRAGPAGDH